RALRGGRRGARPADAGNRAVPAARRSRPERGGEARPAGPVRPAPRMEPAPADLRRDGRHRADRGRRGGELERGVPARAPAGGARFTTMTYTGILAGPAVIGWVAQHVGLTWTLAALIPLLLAVAGGARLAGAPAGSPSSVSSICDSPNRRRTSPTALAPVGA